MFVFVHFVIQHAKRMRRIIFSSAACLPLPYIFTLFHKCFVCQKELNTDCASWFSWQTLLEIFLILSIIGEMVRYMQTGLGVKHPVCLSDFKETSTDFRENLKYKIEWQFLEWLPSCSRRKERNGERSTQTSQLGELAFRVIVFPSAFWKTLCETTDRNF